MLYEIAILEMPTKKEVEEGTGQEKLVLGPKAVVANDGQSAAIAAVLDTPDLKIDRTRMKVLVRPFVAN